MMHPLDDAHERIRGARERLDELKPEIEAFRAEKRSGVTYERRPESMTIDGRQKRVVVGTLTARVFPAPLKVSRLIGEVIQNLRTALDYLVYELTCHDAKAVVERTQFPIADSEEIFQKLLRRYNLKGNMSAEHITAIERLQPYKGCHWTKWLAEFSNPDKHKHLSTIASPVTVMPSPGSTDAILAGQEVDMESEISIPITFSDGTRVVEGLENLASQVSQVLGDFHPQFER